MGIDVQPATAARFDDVATMLGPKNPASSVCWCLSHRLDSGTNRSLLGPARGDYVRALCERPVAPGVLAYEDGVAVGWAAVAPRAEQPFAKSGKIPHVDALPVWSVWCVRATEVGASPTHCCRARSNTPGRRGHRRSRAIRWTTRGRA